MNLIKFVRANKEVVWASLREQKERKKKKRINLGNESKRVVKVP